MPISLVATAHNERYTLNKKPALLIKDGKEFFVTETGSMFPVEEFVYVFVVSESQMFDNDGFVVKG